MANFKYSTPDRRIGSRTLSFLPTEIYMEIINYFQPSERTSVGECKRVLSNLARVCRFFCAVALRKMYQTLEFSGDMYSPTTEPSYSPFCATLNKTSIKGDNSVHPDSDVRFAVEVSQFVRACVFADWSMEGSQRRWSSPFLENFSNAILRMPHLESIRLERTALTQQLIRAIAKSQKLKTLCIRSCTLDPALISPKFAGISSLELSTLEYFDSPALGVEPSMIRLQQLEVFRTDSPKFGQYFLKRDHPHLHTLELRIVEDLELLYSFLARTPSITELAINSIVAKSGGPPPTLPPSALSNIHTVHVSLSFLGHFQKRPLRKVSLNTGQFRNWSSEVLFAPALPLTTMDDLAPLIRSASSITELNIPQHIYFVFPLHKHTKNLEALALAYDHPNYTTIPVISSATSFRETILSICTKWPESPPLLEFRMDFGDTRSADESEFVWNLELQLDMIAQLCARFPLLTSVSFARFVKWQRCDVYVEWRAFVPHRFHAFVKDKLARGQLFTDYYGCLDAFDYK